MSEREPWFRTLKLAVRVHGPLDGVLIWSARRVQMRFGHRAARPLWNASNHLEGWWFRRRISRIVRERKDAA